MKMYVLYPLVLAMLMAIIVDKVNGQTSSYQPCPESFSVENRYAYATSAFGLISLVGCIAVLTTIYAYKRDRQTLRDRILVGMFMGNLIFSLANTIPINLYITTDDFECGGLVATPLTFATGQGLFLFGKYMMVFYENFIVIASVAALYGGVKLITTLREIIGHIICVLAGFVVFMIWMIKTLPLLESAAHETSLDSNLTQSDSKKNIDDVTELLNNLVEAWVPFFGSMLLLWLWQRVKLHYLLKEWDDTLEESMDQWDRDLWDQNSTYHVQTRMRRRKLLDIVKEGYTEIAKPLEPYIVVFVIFSVPAIVMATQFCEQSNQHYDKLGRCDPIALMVLSMRTLTSVYVYFRDYDRRAELWDFHGTSQKVWNRMRLSCGRDRRATLQYAPESIHIFDPEKPLILDNNRSSLKPSISGSDEGGATVPDIEYSLMEDYS